MAEHAYSWGCPRAEAPHIVKPFRLSPTAAPRRAVDGRPRLIA